MDSSVPRGQEQPFDPDTCGFAVFATQGGGLARCEGSLYIFVEAPEGIPEFGIGDTVPAEWGIVPINNEARSEDEPDTDFDFDPAGLPGYV